MRHGKTSVSQHIDAPVIHIHIVVFFNDREIIKYLHMRYCMYTLRGPYRQVIRVSSFFLTSFKNRYGIGNNV